MTALDVTETPSERDMAVIAERLTGFNAEDVGPSGRRVVAVVIRDEDGQAQGGLSGYTAWGWLFTQLLFVPPEYRGQGMAGRLLDAAEKEAVTRGCHAAWIDTFSPQALRAYQRQGYAVFGELPEFVAGRSRYFLQKKLG